MSRELAALARHWLRRGIRRSDHIGVELRRVDPMIDQAKATNAPMTPRHHPVVQHLDAALHGFRGLEALAQSGPLLPWRYGYDPHPSRAGLEDRLAWAEIIGPDAPLQHAALCLGFVLVAPHTNYPAHAHPALELYHVISGRARWTAGGTVEDRRPGDFILHPSGIRHAMSTSEEPLLTIYTWTGDVASPSRFLP
jgi:mannose-6-phosphate isomerase-like protein (cupin superfamily)